MTREFWTGCRPRPTRLFLHRPVHRHDLSAGRLGARAGLHLHVPVAALPVGDARRAELDRHLPRLARRAARQASRRARAGRAAATASIAAPASPSARPASTSATALQLECIGCGLCIDACNDVMDKVGRPRGLIAFDTLPNQARASAAGRSRASASAAPAHHHLCRGAAGRASASWRSALAHARDRSSCRCCRPRAAVRAPVRRRSATATRSRSQTRAASRALFELSADGPAGCALHVAERDEPPVAGGAGVALAVKADSVGTFRVLCAGDRATPAEARDASTFSAARHRRPARPSTLRLDLPRPGAADGMQPMSDRMPHRSTAAGFPGRSPAAFVVVVDGQRRAGLLRARSFRPALVDRASLRARQRLQPRARRRRGARPRWAGTRTIELAPTTGPARRLVARFTDRAGAPLPASRSSVAVVRPVEPLPERDAGAAAEAGDGRYRRRVALPRPANGTCDVAARRGAATLSVRASAIIVPVSVAAADRRRSPPRRRRRSRPAPIAARRAGARRAALLLRRLRRRLRDYPASSGSAATTPAAPLDPARARRRGRRTEPASDARPMPWHASGRHGMRCRCWSTGCNAAPASG